MRRLATALAATAVLIAACWAGSVLVLWLFLAPVRVLNHLIGAP